MSNLQQYFHILKKSSLPLFTADVAVLCQLCSVAYAIAVEFLELLWHSVTVSDLSVAV